MWWPWQVKQVETRTADGTGPDGIPIRDGLTHEDDRRRVLDMLCLCGECDGVQPNESYSSYLRRLLDRLIELERVAGVYRETTRWP